MNSKMKLLQGTQLEAIPTNTESRAHLIQALMLTEEAVIKLIDLSVDELFCIGESDENFTDWNEENLLCYTDSFIQLLHTMLCSKRMIIEKVDDIIYKMKK